MTAFQASFPTRYEQRSGARCVSVLTGRYSSIRPDFVVRLPILNDRHLGSFHATVGRYEKIWVDPVYAVTDSFNIDYSSGLSGQSERFDVVQDYLGGSETWLGSFQADFSNGKAVCLWQSFEVVQDYLGGTETWLGSHGVDFALGRAVCLWQSFEVVQDYLGGSEAWLASHQVDFALGRAVCLWQSFEIVQDYLGGSEAWLASHQVDFALGRAVCLYHSFEIIQSYIGGSEAWTSSYGQDFALGRAVCLNQLYRIDQPYVGGVEEWPSLYGAFFSSGSGTVLAQALDVIQPYQGGREDLAFLFDRCCPSMTAQKFLVGTETTEIAGLGVAIVGIYESRAVVTDGTIFGLDCIVNASYFDAVFSRDCRFYYHCLATAATGPVMIDTLDGRPRTVDMISTFEVPENYSVEISGRYDFTEYGTVRLCSIFETRRAGHFLLHLQEEAWFVYTACLTNVHAGQVTTVATTNLDESIGILAKQCIGDAEWQVEYETTIRFYNPDRPEQSRDAVLWRFLTKDEKHWKQGPIVTDLRAVRLPSFLELHFSAGWPYRSFERQVNAYQFQPTEEGDWFDLGVWISDSARINTDERPLLTIPYTSETMNYDVHVPRQETARYIGVAPIRRFPYEEVGALAVICVL